MFVVKDEEGDLGGEGGKWAGPQLAVEASGSKMRVVSDLLDIFVASRHSAASIVQSASFSSVMKNLRVRWKRAFLPSDEWASTRSTWKISASTPSTGRQ